MVDFAAMLPETKERRCPACQSGTITPANHLLAIDDRLNKVTKEEFRVRPDLRDRVLGRAVDQGPSHAGAGVEPNGGMHGCPIRPVRRDPDPSGPDELSRPHCSTPGPSCAYERHRPQLVS